MKSERIKQILLFLITELKYFNAFETSVPLLFGLNANTSRIILRIWLFPFFGGMNCSTSSVKNITPTLSLFLIAEKA